MQNAHTRHSRLWALLVFAVLAVGAMSVSLVGCSSAQGSGQVTPAVSSRSSVLDAQGVGTLLLACRPAGCMLSLNEREVREVGAVAEPSPLPAGQYRALLSAEGYLPVRELLTIEAGAVTEWAVELWPEVDGVDNGM